MQTLIAAVRRACSAAVWSRGVELSRGGAVVGERQNDEEIELRVRLPNQAVAPTVYLYPQDNDWSCDCPSRDDACVHVAAAVIALNQAKQSGEALPAQAQATMHVAYELTPMQGGLALQRHVVNAATRERIDTSLTRMAQAGTHRTLVPTQTDMAVDVLLAGRNGNLLSRVNLLKLLALLRDCPDVSLGSQKVAIGETQPVMRGRLQPHAGGMMLSVVQDKSIRQVFDNGAVLAGDTVRPIGNLAIEPQELETLRRGKFYGQQEIAHLVTEVLPNLKKILPVDAPGAALPEVVNIAAHLQLATHVHEGRLEVLPTLVYGDPPVARIDVGRMHHLGGAIPRRDLARETRLGRELEETLGVQLGQRVVLSVSEAVAFVAKAQRIKVARLVGDGAQAFAVHPTLTPQVSIGEGGRFEVTFHTPGTAGQSGHTVSGEAVLQAWQERAGYVPLLEGGFAPLPQAWLAQHGHRVLDLLLAKQDQPTLPPHALPDLARLCEALNHPAPADLAGVRAILDNFNGLKSAPLPSDLQASLRDYQRVGVNWLTFLRDTGMGAMLADDMGLGKTLQALCAVQAPALVVAPTSVMANWQQEVARFRPGLLCHVYHGAGRKLDPNADITLTTYAILRLDTATLATHAWRTVVLDEAQMIKNPDSQVAQAAYQLPGAFRITLTGTPVENRLDELWSQFHFTNPGLLAGRRDFQERYGQPIALGEPGAAARLQERIRPFMLRRLKRDVARELPQRTDVVLRCTLDTAERAVYDAIRAATMADVVQRLQEGGSVLKALEALLRLRQACCHTALVPGQQASRSAKIDLLMATLDEAVSEKHKALVFSQWTGLLDLVEPHLRDRNISHLRLDGSTADRAGVVSAFQADDGPPVMLVSLKAGGTGINLTAADHVFLLDPWWNPAVEDQAADRAHRIGQQRPVLVHRLVAEDTVEERILLLQDEKRALAQAALEGSDRGGSLTRDDLLALLQ